MNSIGHHEVTDVTSIRCFREPIPGTTDQFREVLTWYRCGEAAGPMFELGREYVIMAGGVDFGPRYVCCGGSVPKPGGRTTVKWEV